MKGFSLIELLIAMSIIIIVVGGVVANYDKFNSRQVLKQTAQTLKNDLRLAESGAITAQKPASGCTQLFGYQVAFTQSSYSVQADCSEGLVGVMTTVTLPGGITFASVPSPILFGVLTQGVASDVTVTVTSSAGSYAISVSRSGDINDLGFQ